MNNNLMSPITLKITLWMGLIFIFAIAIILWINTPDLFEYFNMAFCAH